MLPNFIEIYRDFRKSYEGNPLQIHSKWPPSCTALLQQFAWFCETIPFFVAMWCGNMWLCIMHDNGLKHWTVFNYKVSHLTMEVVATHLGVLIVSKVIHFHWLYWSQILLCIILGQLGILSTMTPALKGGSTMLPGMTYRQTSWGVSIERTTSSCKVKLWWVTSSLDGYYRMSMEIQIKKYMN